MSVNIYIIIILKHLVIIINPDFSANSNNEIWDIVNKHVTKLKQDIFKQSGVSVDIFTNIDIKLTKGKV